MLHNYSGISARLQRLALTALLAGGTTLAAQAQFTYTPGLATSIAGTYTDLGTNGTAIAVANTDDANSAATDIGFTFNFNGTAFTQFVLNTNGLLRLGASGPAQALAASAYAQDPTTGPVNSGDAADTNLIMPFNFDLTAGTSRPEYRVYTTGTAGSRVCTIQWKNVSDKEVNASSISSTTVPTQFGNFSFQVKLYEGSNQVDFVYDLPTSLGTSGLKYVVVGLKGSAANSSVLASKNSLAAWSTTGFFTGPQPANTAGNANNIRSVAPPDAGRTYRFVQAVANDAAVTQLYTIERVPAGQSYAYSAVIRNVGTTAITNAVVTLTVSGANSATQSITIPSIAVGVGGVITFPAVTLSASGTNNVSVALASDGNNNNNTQTGTTVTSASNTTTAATFSYINPAANFPDSYGFGPSTTGGTFTSAFCAAFTPTAAFNVNVVRAQLGNDTNSVGQKVYGVVLDMSGNVLGRSPDFTITAADINTLHTFTLSTPVSITAGTKFLVGLAQIVESTAFYPMAYQVERPSRTGTYYTAYPLSAVPTDITSSTNTSYSIRYALEAGGLGTALATNSPALARAIDVYPNPSTSGVFSLDVRGANAAAGLGVEVADQLGRRVYTGSARDNFATTLDLSGLAPGIYHLTLRNGDQFTSSRISIVK